MSYLATATNSVIDVSTIRTLLVQGDATYPVIRFVLDPSLTGLSWRVRGSYIGTAISVTSEEITPTETVTEVTLDWAVSADFTTLAGAMQLSLVGSNEAGTTVVKFLGEVTVQEDLSVTSMGTITQNLFEQLMAQANTAISKYPYVDETTGNWFVWNPTGEVFEDTGHSASPKWITGTGITGTSSTPTAFSGSGITVSNAGDMYLNTSTSNTYKCTLGGNAATALWAYVSNIKGATGATGATGAGVPTGGTTDQALVKTSGTNYATGWADISTERTATLASGAWSGSSAPYSQAVTITGVTVAGKPPIIDVVLSDTYATALLETAAYGLIYRFKITGDNTVTAYATAVPSQAINIHAKLVR